MEDRAQGRELRLIANVDAKARQRGIHQAVFWRFVSRDRISLLRNMLCPSRRGVYERAMNFTVTLDLDSSQDLRELGSSQRPAESILHSRPITLPGERDLSP